MQTISNRYLGIVNDRGQRNLPLERVYSNICDRDLFLTAYHQMAKKKGAMTEGSDTETIDEMSIAKIDKIIATLKNGKYKPKPSRRVYIPKRDGTKRSLGIPCWTDKLIQRVVMMVLESYYEPQFSDHSHGFRPKRGCHTALEEIAMKWKGTKWFIEGDIKGCLDNINHEYLLKILSNKILDNRLIKLIRMWLKAGYIENWEYHTTYSGTPQGGVISPLLANIYLTELDYKLEQLSQMWHIGESRKPHPEYTRLLRKINKAKQAGNIQVVNEARKELNIAKSKGLTWSNPQDENYRRLKFVRYADDFIIGFVGNKIEATNIKTEIKQFLKDEIGLTLSDEKTKVTNATHQKARFLNFEIYTEMSKTRPKINGTIRLDMPHDIFVKWKRKYTKNGKPYHRPYYLELSDYMIVRAYNSEFQGIYQYYIMAQNVAKRMCRLKNFVMTSAAKTLSSKHKTSVSKIFKKYNKTTELGIKALIVEVKRKGKPSLIATLGNFNIKWIKCPSNFFGSMMPNCDKIKGIKVATNRTAIRSDLITRFNNNTCEICGSKENIEVHHIRKMSDIEKHKEGWQKLMSSMRRKTLITCKECHHKIHTGKYDRNKL
jgi:group II intron reverse transcriptase/maturase